MTTRIQLRRDTAANWANNNPVLASAEVGVETDTGKFKIGDGTTSWTSLDYASGGIAGATAPVTYDEETQTVAFNYGTGLTTSSGTLTADFGTVSGKVVQGDDFRLSDARTPTAHKTTHATGGSDALSAADIGAATSGHNHSGTYEPAGTVASAISSHEASSDPHPTYLTTTEGNSAYDALGSAAAAVAAHAALSDPHPTYLTSTEGNAAYDSLGTASSIVSAHTIASDPHGDRANAASTYVPLTAIGTTVASLSSGKIPTDQLPAIAITDTFVVNSQAAMLALTAETGDIAIRTDLNKSFVLSTNSPSTLADWKELLTPTDAVLSVDNRTGAVTLSDRYDSLGTASTLVTAHGTTTTNVHGISDTVNLVTLAGTQTLTNKTINLGSNTITGTFPASSLSGGTLASNVTTSSLTSFGTSPSFAGTFSATAGTLTGSFGVGGSITTGTISAALLNSTGNVTATGTISAAALGGSLLGTAIPTTASGSGTAGTSLIPSRQDHQHPAAAASGSSYVVSFSRTGSVSTGVGTFRWYNYSGGTRTIGTVSASVGTAPTGSSLIVDVNVGTVTIFGTQTNRPTIGTASFIDTGGSKSITTIDNGSYFTVDIDQVGSTISGSDLLVQIWLT